MYARLVNCWAAGDPRLRVVDVEHRQRDRVVVAPEVDCHTCHMTIEQRHIYIYMWGEILVCGLLHTVREYPPSPSRICTYIHITHACGWWTIRARREACEATGEDRELWV